MTPDRLKGLTDTEWGEGTTYDTRAPELMNALGGLGLGETRLTGIGGDHHVPHQTQTLDMIEDETIRDTFERSIADAADVGQRIGLTAPTISDLIAAKVDFVDLASWYQQEENARNRPELVLAPAVLPITEARALFSQLRQDTTIPNNPLKERDGVDALDIAPVVEAVWPRLWVQMVAPEVNLVASAANEGWSLRIVSAANIPPHPNLRHDGRDKDGFPQVIPVNHMTVPEYLMLQAILIQSGCAPIDTLGWSTWLAGKLNYGDTMIAPFGRVTDGLVCLATSSPHSRRDGYGIRSAKEAFYG